MSRVAAALRVLQWRWGLSPAESQAAEYATALGVDAMRRQYIGDKRSLRRIEKQLAKAREAA